MSEKIIADNALIASFMGLEKREGTNTYWNKNKTASYGLFYHRDWDMLMPVIEKIEGMNVPVKYKHWTDSVEDAELCFTFQIEGFQCIINYDILPQYHGTHEDFLNNYDCRNKSKIDSTYKAVIAWIKWYNNQMKNPNQPV